MSREAENGEVEAALLEAAATLRGLARRLEGMAVRLVDGEGKAARACGRGELYSLRPRAAVADGADMAAVAAVAADPLAGAPTVVDVLPEDLRDRRWDAGRMQWVDKDRDGVWERERELGERPAEEVVVRSLGHCPECGRYGDLVAGVVGYRHCAACEAAAMTEGGAA